VCFLGLVYVIFVLLIHIGTLHAEIEFTCSFLIPYYGIL